MLELKNKKVLIIGSGPTMIGQTGEGDQGAVEACLALARHQCSVIAVDSNPDAVLTQEDLARATYLEPLTKDSLTQIVAKEKPDAVLPIFGGRTGLYLTSQLARTGVLEQHRVAIWGGNANTLSDILDRDVLNTTLSEIGLKTPAIFPINNEQSAVAATQDLGYPVVLRCDDPNLIPDGTMVYNQEELAAIMAPVAGEPGLRLTVEASLWDWQQAEVEILRDRTGRTRLAGVVEYLDAAGIHPGDAIGVCPPQTLADELIVRLFDTSKQIADHLNIVGGATLRFAHKGSRKDILVLAVHPRYTRTSVLAERVTGIPLAHIATLLAAGAEWGQLPEDINLPPDAPYPAHKPATIAVNWPVLDFSQIPEVMDNLGSRMQAVGHVIGLGSNFREALYKAAGCADPVAEKPFSDERFQQKSLDALLEALAFPSSKRLSIACAALQQGGDVQTIAQRIHMAPWFIEQLKEPVDAKIQTGANTLVTRLLPATGSRPRHYYCANGGQGTPLPDHEKKVILLGMATHRIGQGAEGDHALFNAALAAEASGYTPITISSNPNSTATGAATAGYCIFGRLTPDNIVALCRQEKPVGVVGQFAGRQGPRLMAALSQQGIPILGTPVDTLTLVDQRAAFWNRMHELGIPQPTADRSQGADDVHSMAESVGYPLLIHPAWKEERPTPVLIRDNDHLNEWLAAGGNDLYPLFMERFLEYAIEAQAEALCDGNDARVVSVFEQIELAGVNTNDSACVSPPYSIAPRHLETINDYTRKVAVALNAKGLFHARFAIYRDTVYLLEAGCTTLRNLALIAKVTRLPVAQLAMRVILGSSLEDLDLHLPAHTKVGVRVAVFPFNVFSQVDPMLGIQMRSTGQVLTMADSFGMAYFKAMQSAANPLPTQGTVLITVTDEDKPSILEPARIFHELGFHLLATRGTHDALAEQGIHSDVVRKLGFGRPHLVDEIKNGNVQMVINTPSGGQSRIDDSYIRKAAIRYHIANITTPASAVAAAKGISARRDAQLEVTALQSGN